MTLCDDYEKKGGSRLTNLLQGINIRYMDGEEEKKIKVLDPYGKEVEGVDVGIETQESNWSTIKLSDGTTIKVQPIVIKVIRTEQYSSNGEPLYIVKTQDVCISENIDKKYYRDYKNGK